MHDQEVTEAINPQVEVQAELLEHLRFELSKAQANHDKNVHEGFADAAASWLPAIEKWQRMIDFVEKA